MKTKLVYSNSFASLQTIPSRQDVPNFTPDEQTQRKRSETPANYCQKAFRRKNLQRIFPIIKWLPEYTWKKAIADFIAGVTVGLTVLPQGLAYATIAGVPPVWGLYSSFVGCFVYIFFGSEMKITIGPTAIHSILTYKYIQGKPPEYATFLSAVTAIVTLLIGILRLGFFANFISRPVVSGFRSGISVYIVITQLRPLLGLSFDTGGFVSTIKGLAVNYNDVRDHNDVYLAIFCIVAILLLKQMQFFLAPILVSRPKLDQVLWFISCSRSGIILFACALFCYLMDPPDPKHRLFDLIEHIPAGLPTFTPPPFDVIVDASTNQTYKVIDLIQDDSSAMIFLPLLGLMEHITVAKAMAGIRRVDVSQETLCIGITNAIQCFFSSYAVGGSFARTTVNAFSGVQTPLGGLYTGVIVLLVLQFLTDSFYYIPKASLAAVITCSVIFMIDWEILLPLWRSKRSDLIPWVITFVVTVGVGIDFGILIGLVISTINLLYYAARPRIKIVEAETSNGRGNKFILIVLDRSLTFPSVDYITYEVNKSVVRFGSKATPTVIDCHHIQYTDFTAAEAMRGIVEGLHEQGYHIIFYRLKPSLLRILQGIMQDSATHFIHCDTEGDLETFVDGGVTRVVTTKEAGTGQSIRVLLQNLMKADAPQPRRVIRRGSMFE